ncbi:PilZ domain-containing protein [Mariprofundus ferrinatatus]|uniref:PilZ domain-containing protein n=1 Tax=Mariprofundus ferrinatatus TaxID=1921087 RepID=A0A2K8L9D4_9PROT|nr:PilZ domain-containing protein [Mariprofundus ferrinatatus]ATX82491.1 PilZ domain-containing protein [Mariprofundus ferrinatatus]
MSDSEHDMERREYYRHPVDVPIQIFPQKEPPEQVSVHEMSEGGLSFQTNVFLEKGAVLKIRIPYIKPKFEALCVVRWRHVSTGGGLFEIGVRFLSEETSFRARMVEQVCSIREYQQQQTIRNRKLTFEEAASEWIDKFADHFGKS